MRKVKPTHGTTWPHCKIFRELDAGAQFRLQQFPERAFLRMVRAGWITGGGTNAAIFLVDELLARKLLTPSITQFDAFSSPCARPTPHSSVLWQARLRS